MNKHKHPLYVDIDEVRYRQIVARKAREMAAWKKAGNRGKRPTLASVVERLISRGLR